MEPNYYQNDLMREISYLRREISIDRENARIRYDSLVTRVEILMTSHENLIKAIEMAKDELWANLANFGQAGEQRHPDVGNHQTSEQITPNDQTKAFNVIQPKPRRNVSFGAVTVMNNSPNNNMASQDYHYNEGTRRFHHPSTVYVDPTYTANRERSSASESTQPSNHNMTARAEDFPFSEGTRRFHHPSTVYVDPTYTANRERSSASEPTQHSNYNMTARTEDFPFSEGTRRFHHPSTVYVDPTYTANRERSSASEPTQHSNYNMTARTEDFPFSEKSHVDPIVVPPIQRPKLDENGSSSPMEKVAHNKDNFKKTSKDSTGTSVDKDLSALRAKILEALDPDFQRELQPPVKGTDTSLLPLGYIRRSRRVQLPEQAKMEQRRIRTFVYYELLLGNDTGTAIANICRACKENEVSQRTARRWFNRFESGDTSRPAPAEDHALLLVGRQELLYFELLPQSWTVTASIYSDQLEKLAAAIGEKRPRRASVHLQHDNARPHVGKETQQKLATLGWGTAAYPPYSSDLAPSDYHLFRPLKHRLAGRKFANYDNLKSDFADLFESQPPEFWAKGIGDLPNRCATVVNNCGFNNNTEEHVDDMKDDESDKESWCSARSRLSSSSELSEEWEGLPRSFSTNTTVEAQVEEVEDGMRRRRSPSTSSINSSDEVDFS
ncbi:unnamed protein product [Caenorhabditis auriculariae]|uniref:Mos1 transposase HTH domain-containing protein n=1 Tax=Caenorhabditis auriculariae TaxID=2777116 RepID=A0A8S1HJ93_9PELO|nr:unnamed protein product [Caenorhabditis auriculariae]